jgi:hypothetical protein
VALWQARKLTPELARLDLIRSRDVSAARLVGHLEFITMAEENQLIDQAEAGALLELQASLGAFRPDPRIDEWMLQYTSSRMLMRYHTLLLRGQSRSGKSQKAMSLFGIPRTLIVNCQGLGKSLPSLREFRKEKHACIVFDEITEEQVLANKLVFQAGPWRVSLSQSTCGQHAYVKHFYGVAMVCCSNTFLMPPHPDLSGEDADWLQENLCQASPPSHCKWYYEDDDLTDCVFA